GDVSEGAEGGGSGLLLAQALFPQALRFELDVGFELGAEVAGRPLAAKHADPPANRDLTLLGTETASDCSGKPLPLRHFFAKLPAAGRSQRIEAGLSIVLGDSPLG